ncbi:MAG: choice-of-anchor J domain-containing protein [Muribaculaceae bacterium]|nr:choice-of-anchor J domain-containing protein [Muribaculaceae bacterium]
MTDNRGTADEFTIDGISTGGEAGDGTAEKPYNVGQIVAMNPTSTTEAVASGVWVSGYIVGSMPTGGSSTTLSGTIFGLDDAANTNMVIAADPGETDYTKCIGIQLPTTMRDALSLQKVPGNLGKQVSLKGDVMKYCGGPGLKNLTEYKLGDGGGDTPVTPSDPLSSLDENFEGGSIPSDWTQVTVSGNKTWYARQFDENWYVTMSGYNGQAPFDQWLISPAVDMSKVSDKTLSFDSQVNGYGSTTTRLEVYVLSSADPATATKTQLSPALPTAPASGYSSWVNSGAMSLSGQNGVVYIGFRYVATQDSNFATWCVDNVKLPASGGSGPVEPPTPPVTGDDKAGFGTFNGGAPKSTYGTYTTESGWTAVNCNILSGSDTGTDSNPRFSFIGSGSTLAPCLNGKAGSAGTLTSPTLTGGLGKLTFNYGFAYKDTKCQFTVNILQNGAVVKTQTVTLDSIEQFKAYEFSWDVNISGDFVIEIVNDSYSAKTSNCDRVAIWNLTWD